MRISKCDTQFHPKDNTILFYFSRGGERGRGGVRVEGRKSPNSINLMSIYTYKYIPKSKNFSDPLPPSLSSPPSPSVYKEVGIWV